MNFLGLENPTYKDLFSMAALLKTGHFSTSILCTNVDILVICCFYNLVIQGLTRGFLISLTCDLRPQPI